MATTRIIPMHHAKGQSIAKCLKDRIGYGENPEKTEGGELISAYECDPKTDYAELAHAAEDAEARFLELKAKIKAAESRMTEIQTLKTHIINYSKTRDIYADYRKAQDDMRELQVHRANAAYMLGLSEQKEQMTEQPHIENSDGTSRS